MTYPKYGESDLVVIRQQFNSLDKDRDGNITEAEFIDALKNMNLNPDEYDYQGFFRKADKNKDGKITFEEFLAAYHELGLGNSHSLTSQPTQKSKEEMDAIFRAFDLDGNGYITKKELAEVLTKQDGNTPQEVVDKMMKNADLNGDGKIDRHEFALINM